MDHCKNCGGSCGGCRKSLELTSGEIELLRSFGQFSFLPVARTASDMTPIYLEDDRYNKETCSLLLQCLERKGLIDISYDAPLLGADMSAYKDFPVHGAMALTLRGQQVLELLDTQGAD